MRLRDLLASSKVCAKPISLHSQDCGGLCSAQGEEQGALLGAKKLGSSQLVSAPPHHASCPPGARAAGVPGGSTDPSSGCRTEEAASWRMVGMGSEKGPGAEEEVSDLGVQALRRHDRSWSKESCKRQAQSTSPCSPKALRFVPGDLAGLLILLAAG